MASSTATDVAELIVADICNRGGGDHWWYEIDPEIQEEIIDAWAEIIDEFL